MGVCSCNGDLGVDSICNQKCRKASPQTTFLSATQIQVTDSDGKSTIKDLRAVGDVYGAPTCSNGAGSGCTVRAAQQDASGAFVGSYSPPSSLLAGRRRRLIDYLRSGERALQAAAANTASFQNPLYCLLTGDTFLFTISDPAHYPKYLKDSVLNTNADFDYGAFLTLESEMKGKRDAALFAFTFDE